MEIQVLHKYYQPDHVADINENQSSSRFVLEVMRNEGLFHTYSLVPKESHDPTFGQVLILKESRLYRLVVSCTQNHLK